MRIDALVRRPADGLRRVADPVVFAFTTQVITHVIWKAFALPETALPVVVDIACSSFALSRLAAIGRLATLYRADVSNQMDGSSWVRIRALRHQAAMGTDQDQQHPARVFWLQLELRRVLAVSPNIRRRRMMRTAQHHLQPSRIGFRQ